MNLRRRVAILLLLLIPAAGAWQPSTTTRQASVRFELSFRESARDQPFTGRVWVILTALAYAQPYTLVNFFSSEPFFALDVKEWQPGQILTFEPDDELSYPCAPADLPPDTYRAQAVMGCNDWAQHPIDAPGNICSDVAIFRLLPDKPVTVRLVLDRKVPRRKLADSETLKYVRMRSRLLSEFHRRDVLMEAAVGLPDAYADEPDKRFPTLYCIPGFDGRLEELDPTPIVQSLQARGVNAVVVCLCASCPLGHHVFADSANNGPWGAALVSEFIPWLEDRFRLIRYAEARYLFGISSGGWSSLWLQITHPDTFGGVWSVSPDPVDFREFVNINLYDPPESVFVCEDGTQRLFARGGPSGKTYWSDMFRLEQVLGRGGQLGSCEAVFSPRGPDGQPLRLWDRKTGRINREVAEAWKKYDIRLVLEQNWQTLGPKLSGKIHIYAGQQDEFFLEQACVRLRDALAKLSSDARVELIDGAGHTPPLYLLSRVADEIAAHFERRYKNRQNPRRRRANPVLVISE